MRIVIGALALAVLPASFGWSQESLCNPCVDPPLLQKSLTPPRSLYESLPAPPTDSPAPNTDGTFNLGASIANLRGLSVQTGVRTLTLSDSRRQIDESADRTDATAGADEPEPETAEPAEPAEPEAESPDASVN